MPTTTLRCNITKSKAGHYHVTAHGTAPNGNYLSAKCGLISSLASAQETVKRAKAAIEAASPVDQAAFKAAFRSACFTGEY